jgi:micrococcal nuclease
VRVIDGDTFVADVDLGFHVTRRETFRVRGIDTPETRGATRHAGDAARAFAASWCSEAGHSVTLRSVKQEKFGRYLADVWNHTGSSLANALISAGHAVPYHGGAR